MVISRILIADIRTRDTAISRFCGFIKDKKIAL